MIVASKEFVIVSSSIKYVVISGNIAASLCIQIVTQRSRGHALGKSKEKKGNVVSYRAPFSRAFAPTCPCDAGVFKCRVGARARDSAGRR